MISQSDYIPTIDSTIAALQTVIVTLGTEIAGLQKTLEIMRSGYESNATMVIDSQRMRCQGLEGELAATRKGHDALLKEREAFVSQIKELREQLDAVPVRAIRRLFVQQFGSHPVSYNAPWDIIVTWLDSYPERSCYHDSDQS